MHFEGILKGYLKAVAIGSTGLVVGGSSIQKGEGNRNHGPVKIGPVGSGFRSFSGPRNWTFKHYSLVNPRKGLMIVKSLGCCDAGISTD